MILNGINYNVDMSFSLKEIRVISEALHNNKVNYQHNLVLNKLDEQFKRTIDTCHKIKFDAMENYNDK